MTRYIKNLLLAIRGRNPFAEEVADLKEKLEKAGENVSGLQDQLYAALNRWDGCQYRLEEVSKTLETAKKSAASQWSEYIIQEITGPSFPTS